MKAKKVYGLALFLVSLVLVAAFSSAVYAKYIKKTEFKGNVTIQADLAEDFKIIESQASRNEMGEYSLVSDTEVSGNEYILMPGVDIPKDPTIKITGKTALPAYLYVEVVDNISDHPAVTYSLADRWQPLAGVTGPNGGKVYVYNEMVDGSTANMSVPIIKGNTVYVGQTLVHSAAAKPFSIKFHAYMLQIPDGTSDAKTIFENTF